MDKAGDQDSWRGSVGHITKDMLKARRRPFVLVRFKLHLQACCLFCAAVCTVGHVSRAVLKAKVRSAGGSVRLTVGGRGALYSGHCPARFVLI